MDYYGSPATIQLSQALTIPVGANLTLDGQGLGNYSGRTATIQGTITCATSNDNSATTTLTLQNLTMDGSNTAKWAIYSADQKNENVSGLALTMENCTVQNYTGKGLYLTNARKLDINSCVFKDNATGEMDNPNTKGDYTIDLNLVAVQNADISITNTTFSGECGKKAAVKVVQRGASDGTGATDITGAMASIANFTLSGCTFGDTTAKADVNLGTAQKTVSADHNNITGNFAATISDNKTDVVVRMPYLNTTDPDSDNTSANTPSLTVSDGQTATKTADGTLILYYQVTVNGGTGGGQYKAGDTVTVTETTKNPAGSQEVVETKKDGTVTTTVTDTDGNKTKTVENTDGTKETTVTNKDGSSSATTVDETGRTETEVKLPAAVVEDAREKGEAVALPMPAVPATTDKENAPTVTVDLPSGSAAQVEIPVEDVTPGTVAILVKNDGTEEVIKTSLTTENGVAVTLSDGDTVKIVDNSKDFADVSNNYWGAEAVDFAVSRELFSGTSATTFSPNTAMNRAMIVTVLARLESVDTSASEPWYEAGRQWAMENGISDGTNMDGALTREQLATMLYRYAQGAGYDVTDLRDLGGYPDADQASSYAVEALQWATAAGLITDMGNGTLNPQGQATRAQVATILMRLIQLGQ